jgi:hypothetical protein
MQEEMQQAVRSLLAKELVPLETENTALDQELRMILDILALDMMNPLREVQCPEADPLCRNFEDGEGLVLPADFLLPNADCRRRAPPLRINPDVCRIYKINRIIIVLVLDGHLHKFSLYLCASDMSR